MPYFLLQEYLYHGRGGDMNFSYNNKVVDIPVEREMMSLNAAQQMTALFVM